jgi:hypothetical protein
MSPDVAESVDALVRMNWNAGSQTGGFMRLPGEVGSRLPWRDRRWVVATIVAVAVGFGCGSP